MDIRFKKGFTKSYKKLGQQEQTKVDVALAIFRKDPFQSILYNHELIPIEQSSYLNDVF